MSAWVTVDIRRLERGDYLAKVNKKTNVCSSFLEAVAWAEKQLEAMQGGRSDPGPVK